MVIPLALSFVYEERDAFFSFSKTIVLMMAVSLRSLLHILGKQGNKDRPQRELSLCYLGLDSFLSLRRPSPLFLLHPPILRFLLL